MPTLLKSRLRPHVFLVENGKRRWVPDPATLETLGGWGAVQTVDEAQIDQHTVGPTYPSVIHPHGRPNGSLIIGSGPAVYVMLNDRRCLIPSWPTLLAHPEWDPDLIERVADSELNAIPMGNPVTAAGQLLQKRVDSFLGSGHYMTTEATLFRETGKLVCFTRTRSITWLGGYTGGVRVILSDDDDRIVDISPEHTYGVNGTLFGGSDRTDRWDHSFAPNDGARTLNLTVAHYWAPNWRVGAAIWNVVGQPVIELGKKLILGGVKIG